VCGKVCSSVVVVELCSRVQGDQSHYLRLNLIKSTRCYLLSTPEPDWKLEVDPLAHLMKNLLHNPPGSRFPVAWTKIING